MIIVLLSSSCLWSTIHYSILQHLAITTVSSTQQHHPPPLHSTTFQSSSPSICCITPQLYFPCLDLDIPHHLVLVGNLSTLVHWFQHCLMSSSAYCCIQLLVISDFLLLLTPLSKNSLFSIQHSAFCIHCIRCIRCIRCIHCIHHIHDIHHIFNIQHSRTFTIHHSRPFTFTSIHQLA